MHLTRLAAVAIASVALSFAAVQADTPAHRYTVDLGAGNEDLEVKIDALPWIPAPIGVHRVKDASNINFAGRDLRCAELHFELNGLYGANFAGCKLDGSSFAETPLYGCSFRDASLRFCVFDRFHPMSDDSNDFSNADIEGSSVPGLPADCLKQTRNYRQGRLRGIRMLDNITGVSFKNMTLDACYLAGRWQTCDGCDLTNASLQRMVITPGFSEQQIRSTDNGQSRDYAEILFLGFGRAKDGSSERDFTHWDFSRFQLGYFVNCDLTDSRFDDAFFLYPLHPYSGMMAERFEINQWSYYENVKSGYIGFDGCTLSEAQMRQTKNWKRKDLRGISLRNMNLVGWDFSSVDMRRANLGGSSLNRVNFTDTNIQGLTLNRCTGLTLQQLQESNTLRTTSDTDVLHIYFNADFDGLTDEQRALQDSLRERWGRR